jgi:5'-3' exonuclease
MNKKFCIIDSYSLLFRSFFAMQDLKTSDGIFIGGIYGFLRNLLYIITTDNPDYLVCALDTGGRTIRDDIYDIFLEKLFIKELFFRFRDKFSIMNIQSFDQIDLVDSDELKNLLRVTDDSVDHVVNYYDDKISKNSKIVIILAYLGIQDDFKISEYHSQYKGNRISTPENLIPQFKILHELLDSSGIAKVSYNNYESDDVIATYVKQAKVYENIQVKIFSSDKDLYQLIDKNVEIYDIGAKKIVNLNNVLDKFGVLPSRIQEYLSLVGDASDNIPGVHGIGPKSALEIINNTNCITNDILKNNDKKILISDKLVDKIKNSKDLFELSLKLIELQDNLPVNSFDKHSIINFSISGLENFCRKYNINVEKYLSILRKKFDTNNRKTLFD